MRCIKYEKSASKGSKCVFTGFNLRENCKGTGLRCFFSEQFWLTIAYTFYSYVLSATSIIRNFITLEQGRLQLFNLLPGKSKNEILIRKCKFTVTHPSTSLSQMLRSYCSLYTWSILRNESPAHRLPTLIDSVLNSEGTIHIRFINTVRTSYDATKVIEVSTFVRNLTFHNIRLSLK